MRFVIGFVLGVLITIGAAYVHDSGNTAAVADPENRQIVNWDVVNKDVQNLNTKVEAEWSRLYGRLRGGGSSS